MPIFSSLAILLTWTVLALALIGLGSLFLARIAKDYSLLDALWIGLASSTALLEIWNLLLPVDFWPAILISLAGVFGIVANSAALSRHLRATLQSSRWLILPSFVIVLFLAFRSSGPCDYYDTGLYGASAVRWIQTYPAVPGLANLHGRFGFNSSVFLLVAALQHGAWRVLAHHLFTGFMLAAFCLTLLPACARAANSTAAPLDWFYSILAIPAIFAATRAKIVGTLTDEPATIASFIAAGMLLESLSHSEEKDKPSLYPARLVVAATLFSLAVVFKLSTVVFALLAWALVIRRLCLSGPAPRRRKLCFSAIAFSVLLLLPWCARNVIVTGYPLYPASIFGFPADWKVPLSVANYYATGVQSWGRIPDALPADTRGYGWLGVWLHHTIRNRPAFQVPLAISMVGLAAFLIFLLGAKPRAKFPGLWLLLPSLPGILFWLLASPDLRFGQFAIWTVAATLGSWGIVSFTSGHSAVRARVAFAQLFLLLLWCLVSFGWKEPYSALLAVKALPTIPSADLVVRHTRSGLAVYVPAQGNQCWDAPLPCTPYFDETLRLRSPLSLRSGFTSQLTANELQKSSFSTAP